MTEVGIEEGGDYAAAFRSLNRMVDEGRSWSGHERNRCFLNAGVPQSADAKSHGPRSASPLFADVSAVSGLDFPDDARSIASVDWDGDGDLDLFQVNRTAPQLRFLRNDWTNEAHWVSFRLVGTSCNRDAIGARIRLFRPVARKDASEGARIDVRTLHAGNAFLTQSSKWVHFGLALDAAIDRIEVYWPGGETESFSDIQPDRHYQLVQGSGQATIVPPRSSAPQLVATVPSVPDETESAQVLLNARLPLPPLAYQTLVGEAKTFSVQGEHKATLIQLWASWCPMCAAEMQEFTDHAERIRAAGLDLLALSVDGLGTDESSAEAAREALRTRRYPFSAGAATLELLSQFEVLRAELFSNARPFPVPTCLLIDSKGQLAAVYVGPVSVDRLLTDVNKLTDSLEQQRTAAMPLAGRWLSSPKPIRLAPIADSMRYANHKTVADWYQRRAAPQTAISHCGLALNAERSGDLKQARVHYQEALKLAPREAEVQNYVGEFLMRQRDFKSALKRFQLATELIDRSAEASRAPDVAAICNYNLGTLLIATGRTENAETALRRAIRFDARHALANTALGKLLYHQKRMDESRMHLETALDHDPHLVPAHVYLARVFVQLRELDPAVRHFEKAIALDDRLVDAHTELASVLGAQGRMNEAVNHYRRSLQLQPGSHAVALQLAWCLATCPDDNVRSGDEAIKLAQEAIAAADSPSPIAFDILAAAQAESGDFAAAIKTLQKAELSAADKPRLQQLLRQHRQLYELDKPLRN